MIENLLISYSFTILFVGFSGFLISLFIPFAQYKLIAQILQIAAIVVGVHFNGVQNERAEWEQKMAKAQAQITQLELDSKEITIKTVIEYRDRIQYIDRVPVQTVREFVTVQADQKCEINAGFVRLHDALVEQKIIDPLPTDEAPQDVKLSAVLDTVKSNYTNAQKNAQQLTSLQQWLKDQKVNWDKK